MKDSFKARTTLACGNQNFEIFSLAALKDRNVARLPYSLKILLENLLRFEDGINVTRAGRNGISDSIDALGAQLARARASSSRITPRPELRRTFSSSTLTVIGARARSAMPLRSSR